MSSDKLGQTKRLLRFAAGYSHVAERGSQGFIRSEYGDLSLPYLPVRFERLLNQLPSTYSRVIHEVGSIGAPAQVTLQWLADLAILEDAVVDSHGEDLAVARRPVFSQIGEPSQQKTVRLAEHAYVQVTEANWLVMHPASRSCIVLSPEIAGTFLRRLSISCEPTVHRDIEQLFLDNGFLGLGEAKYRFWEFHDAVIHGASTHGYIPSGKYGAIPTASVPALDLTGRSNGEVIELARIDVYPKGLEVLTTRRTKREFSKTPVPMSTLSALLDLALRAQSVDQISHDQHVALYPYPSGGARDEIRTIVAVSGSDSTDAFVAAYLSLDHKLFCYDSSSVASLDCIATLSGVCDVSGPLPSIALLFAADYGRMASKYRAIAYATILRNVGCIYQTVSLAAAALGLVSCCVGGGWGALERDTLNEYLRGRVIVGGMIIGTDEANSKNE